MLNFKCYYVPVTVHVKYARSLVRMRIAGVFILHTALNQANEYGIYSLGHLQSSSF